MNSASASGEIEFFENPIEKFVVKNILVVSSDKDAAEKITYFEGRIRGNDSEQTSSHGPASHGPAVTETLRKARNYIKNNDVNILLLDPAIGNVTSVLNFVKDIRLKHKHIVWVALSSKSWWDHNKKAIQKHPWGKRFSKYYKLFKKDLVGDEGYKHFVFTMTACHWDFVLQLLDDAAQHIIMETPKNRVTSDQVKKFIEKGMAPLQSLWRDQSNRIGGAFVSMPQFGSFPAQYKVAIQPPLKAAKYNPFFAGDARIEGQVSEEVFSRIRDCSLFVADLSELRPSVLIEIGYALALDVPRILVRNHKLKDKDLPFLIQGVQIPAYLTVEDLKDLISRQLAWLR